MKEVIRDMETIVKNIEDGRVNIEQVKDTLKVMIDELKKIDR